MVTRFYEFKWIFGRMTYIAQFHQIVYGISHRERGSEVQLTNDYPWFSSFVPINHGTRFLQSLLEIPIPDGWDTLLWSNGGICV